jgi:hypothetical protein
MTDCAEPAFPTHLLSRSKEERLQYFEDCTVAHPIMLGADKQIRQRIGCPAGKALQFLIGPSGVGKTALVRQIYKMLLESWIAEMKEAAFLIPVIQVEAPPVDNGRFSIKAFSLQCLAALNEPLIQHKREKSRWEALSNPDASGGPLVRKANPLLLEALITTLKHRGTRAVLIDEAQHMLASTGTRALGNNMDVLKSLSNRTDTQFVLFGTYDLLATRELNPQLWRRSRDVHFPRYNRKVSGEGLLFRSALHTLASHLPLTESPALTGDRLWPHFYERTNGCVGSLKLWLEAALYEAIDSGLETLPVSLLERHAPPMDQVQKVL